MLVFHRTSTLAQQYINTFDALLFPYSVQEVPVTVPRRHRPAVGGRKHRCTQPEDQYRQQDPGHGSEW